MSPGYEPGVKPFHPPASRILPFALLKSKADTTRPMRLLETVDADEVSPVARGANRKGLVLKEDDMAEDAEIVDIMAVPWEREGAMIDEIRKAGGDETVVKGAVAAMRLLNGVADELPDEMREAVEKLGSELYSRQNPPLNTTNESRIPGEPGELTGSGSGAPKDGSGKGPGSKDGSGRDGELIGSGSGAPTNKAAQDDDDDELCKAAYDEDLEKAQRTFSASSRRGMARRGVAMPDGSFPIPDADALRRAKLAVGRANPSKRSAVRAHINRRAKALGLPGLGSGVAKADEALEDVLEAEGVEPSLVQRVLKSFRKSQDVRPHGADDPSGGDTSVPDDEPDNDNDDNAIAKGGPVEAHEVPIQKADGTWDLSGVPEPARAVWESVLKAQTETAEKLEKAETELAETREALRTEAIIAKAEKEFAHIGARDDVVAVLKAASEKLDGEGYEKLVALLSASDERIAKSSLMDELGRSSFESVPAGDAWDKIEKAADEYIQKAESGMTREQAIDRVLKTRDGQVWYGEYLAETGIGRVN